MSKKRTDIHGLRLSYMTFFVSISINLTILNNKASDQMKLNKMMGARTMLTWRYGRKWQLLVYAIAALFTA
ncbi:hypothetical protein AAULR_05303 [Lacticaseibacillus rhamnosus MTCC 5462]|nr:hypothetical protein AAULR_05303 [Lacticaseibacillus rhamnosus MTCC 5462]